MPLESALRRAACPSVSSTRHSTTQFLGLSFYLGRVRKREERVLARSFALGTGEIARAPSTDAVSHAFGRVKANLESHGIRIEDFDCDRRGRPWKWCDPHDLERPRP